MKTNSSRDVPISSKEKKYPVLIFSHGWGEHYSQNTILMEELASHGYIVFSIAHHYECKFSSYPDGRFIYIEMDNPDPLPVFKQPKVSGMRAIVSKPIDARLLCAKY
ncbi:MAG: hypothetical protein JW755_11520 [Candidatus Aminicenantes bacterium]|nr:hypothetical protein [Candidatus Aminicenantes bacterium]